MTPNLDIAFHVPGTDPFHRNTGSSAYSNCMNFTASQVFRDTADNLTLQGYLKHLSSQSRGKDNFVKAHTAKSEVSEPLMHLFASAEGTAVF